LTGITTNPLRIAIESDEKARRQHDADQIAADFEAYLDSWHGAPEVFDDALDAQIHRWYADILTNRQRKVWPPKDVPYFSPSSANSDPRELYEKLRGAKRDIRVVPPHQGRWTRIGTAIGDVIQRDILFAEKHFEKATGSPARFRFERSPLGEPMFEDFAKTSRIIEHKPPGANTAKYFALYGTCDGIMRYVSEDGEVLRVGLEVKSKQTTAAQTSEYSTRKGPKEDHVKQTVCYSLMYGTPDAPIDYYVILYVNASKKAWEMSPDEYAKNRDIKAFGIAITDEMKAEVLDGFADVVDATENGTPPPLDLDRWTFNGYKSACSLSLTDEEMAGLERKVAVVMASGLPEWQKRGAVDALEMIRRIRAEHSSGGAA
jgi:hypothetical protein